MRRIRAGEEDFTPFLLRRPYEGSPVRRFFIIHFTNILIGSITVEIPPNRDEIMIPIHKNRMVCLEDFSFCAR